MADDEGTEVAKGKHVVPNGVAVEELDGGKKKLSDECPPLVRALLEAKDLMLAYDQMVAGIVNEGKTRSKMFGHWHDNELVSVMDLFRDEFSVKGVKLALCKRKSAPSLNSDRWIEFIDTDIVPNYVSTFDVANTSGQVIKTLYQTLEFPNGVAVEELKRWKDRTRLRDKIPVYVEVLMKKHNLMMEYEQFVETCLEHGVGSRFKKWNTKKLKEIILEFRPRFEAKGIAIFVCVKQEWVQHGQSGHVETFRWIEFVDRAEQPNYEPQRDADTKKETCIVS